MGGHGMALIWRFRRVAFRCFSTAANQTRPPPRSMIRIAPPGPLRDRRRDVAQVSAQERLAVDYRDRPLGEGRNAESAAVNCRMITLFPDPEFPLCNLILVFSFENAPFPDGS